ncbi:MAG: hypothetical protein LBP35_05490 [Candidatus Ancillula trichonymphae]|nr:hypothetical protein [Candidatus Ancillula trichonymphae]
MYCERVSDTNGRIIFNGTDFGDNSNVPVTCFDTNTRGFNDNLNGNPKNLQQGNYIIEEKKSPPTGYLFASRTYFLHLEEGNSWYTVALPGNITVDYVKDVFENEVKMRCQDYKTKDCPALPEWHFLPQHAEVIGDKTATVNW